MSVDRHFLQQERELEALRRRLSHVPTVEERGALAEARTRAAKAYEVT